jgi:hypothetical protein
MIKKLQRNIRASLEKCATYYAYFGVKSWAPHKVCCVCVEDLRKWSKGKKKEFRFGFPVIWREPKNHSDDCCF